jgi:hypothetical protein
MHGEQRNSENRPRARRTVSKNSHSADSANLSIYQSNTFDKYSQATSTSEFLQSLFGDLPEDCPYFHTWKLQGRVTGWYDSVEAASAFVAQHADADLYVGIAITSHKGTQHTRITSTSAGGIVALVADIDIAGDGHGDKRYPPTLEAALALLGDIPLPPSYIINSGGGAHAWWLLREPWVFDNDAEREEATKLLRDWQMVVSAAATLHGYEVDNVGDIARLMRLPGTHNRKLPDNPRPVTIMEANSHRYNPLDFEQHLVTPPADIIPNEPAAPPVQYNIGEDQLLKAAFNARNGATIRKLFEQAGATGNSEGDASLCGLLAFYSGGDAELLERLMRRSNRIRDKWDERRGDDTWIGLECRSAIERHSGNWYIPRAAAPPDSSSDGDAAEAAIEADPQVVRLMRIAESADFFRDENSEPHVTLPNGETFAMVERGGGFRSWLCNRFYEAEGRPPNSTALAEANMMCCAAATERPFCDVALRVGSTEDTVYLDLANEAREVVAINADGWTVTRELPSDMRFRRPPEMRALPQPQHPGKISLLRDFLNVNDDDFKLCVAWLLATLRTGVPYPILTLLGEQGTAKSTATRLLWRIVDAAVPETTRPPSGDSDLFAVVNNNYVLALENISYIPPELSDSLSAIATGAGLTKRKLYTDGDTYSSAARRPIIMNGIGEIATRGDLIDRCLVVTLNSISDADRIDERTFWANAETILPSVLGGLLTAASVAMYQLPHTRLTSAPRMADFAQWVVAAEPALPWQAGEFMEVYAANREAAVLSILESDAFARLLYRIALNGFEGTATALGMMLEKDATEREVNQRSWPRNARAISERVTRLAPALRAAGIDVDRGRRGNDRIIIFRPHY